MATTEPQIDFTSPAFKKNPYEILANMRRQNPVAKISLPGDRTGWLVTRYEDVETLIKDPRLSIDIRDVYPPEVIQAVFPFGEVSEGLLHSMVFSNDPKTHSRLRNLVSHSFTPRYIETWQGRIQNIIDEIINQLPEHGEIDLIREVAFPLPMIVISEMLGIPVEDREKFRDWSNSYVDSLGNPAAAQAIIGDMAEFQQYLFELIEAKRANPSDDLLSKLVSTDVEGDRLSRQELIGMTLLLVMAGNETTTTLISSAMLTLFQNPEQKELLKQNPALLKPAIEEFIRYQGPLLNLNDRWAVEDFEYKGQQIKKGESVYLCVASANRDEERFQNGNSFNVQRSDLQRHVGFGLGMHYCLGAPLARLEGVIGLHTILQRLPEIRLAVPEEELTWRPSIITFALEKLPVRF
ncbi:cytochrome P450 family protein [Ktedonospora formicarum]|uniref:Cytochrome P450 n=1 Tax=Ktedonospora formicarum TaxID=2778364 RepID=A0A8J3I753_9CHLR|nr:cytochrome P450 [Ktedonospora formicarum]GHO46669.1 cytochrome P450 [Ktedonospora formicarum]